MPLIDTRNEEPGRRTYYHRMPIGVGRLNQVSYPGRMSPGDMQALVNGVYLRRGAIGKRTGSGTYGGGPNTGKVGTNKPVISGTRWHRALLANAPSVLARMVVQSNDNLYSGNDGTGVFTSLGALAANSSPAFFASAFDTNTNSDTLVIAYGSGTPKKWDGVTLSALNAGITNLFTGVENFHEHLWFWGDPNFPDTIFATDLENIQSLAFAQTFGGYPINRGDGDPTVRRCIKAGDTLYAFKTNSIKTISGFDFQAGEYQFSLQPYADDVGIPSPHCADNIRGVVFFWSGEDFYMLVPGAPEPISIGDDIILEIAAASARNQNVVRCVAGNFLVQTIAGTALYSDYVLWAMDDGSGVAARILAFDYGMYKTTGQTHWSVWTGLDVGCFIPWKGAADPRLLYIGGGSATNDQVALFGANATSDVGSAAVAFMLETLRDDMGTPEQLKELDRAYLAVEASAATFSISTLAESNAVASQNAATPSAGGSPGIFGAGTFGTSTFGASGGTAYQTPDFEILPPARGRNFSFVISEQSATASYEILGLTVHVTEDAYATT